MSTPGQPKRPIVVVSGLNRRDILLIVTIVIIVAGFLISAFYETATHKPKNNISGIITGRERTGVRETEMLITGGGVKSGATTDTGYYLKVFVKEENRTYTVMVERELWEAKKDGDTLSFLRPVNEQQY